MRAGGTATSTLSGGVAVSQRSGSEEGGRRIAPVLRSALGERLELGRAAFDEHRAHLLLERSLEKARQERTGVGFQGVRRARATGAEVLELPRAGHGLEVAALLYPAHAG